MAVYLVHAGEQVLQPLYLAMDIVGKVPRAGAIHPLRANELELGVHGAQRRERLFQSEFGLLHLVQIGRASCRERV